MAILGMLCFALNDATRVGFIGGMGGALVLSCGMGGSAIGGGGEDGRRVSPGGGGSTGGAGDEARLSRIDARGEEVVGGGE
jgi:hypothetical protein